MSIGITAKSTGAILNFKTDDGGICPVKVYCKDFTQGSGAFRIR